MSKIVKKPGDVFGFFGPYRFLSNFYPSEVLPPTLEHHYQAMKAGPVGYLDVLAVMKDVAMSPGQAKRYGRMVQIQPNWEVIKDRVMLDLVRRKFQQPSLAKALLATQNSQLYELNTWGDSYWGITELYKDNYVGLNKLGKALMIVRDELAK